MSSCRLCGNMGAYDKDGHTESCGEWQMGLFSDYTQREGEEADWRKGIYFGRFGDAVDPRLKGKHTWHEEAFFPARYCPLCGKEL